MLALDTLAELALRSSLVLAVASMIALVLRRRPATLRHAVWVAAMLVLIALPLVSILAPGVGAGFVDLHRPASSPPAVLHEANAPPSPPQHTSAASQSATADPVSHARAIPRVDVLLPFVWALGVTVVLAAMLLQWGVVAWTLRRREPFGTTVNIDTRGVPLCGSARARVPFVWGVWRPLIVMPAGSEAWSRERLLAIVLHELAHIRRRDPLTRTLGCVAAALFWFNPLAWFALSRLEAESEAACDDAVVASGLRATDYARHLLAVAETMSRHAGVVGAVGMARRPQVEHRLRRLLDPRRAAQRASLVARVIAIVLLVGLSVPIGTVRIVASPTMQVGASSDGISPADYAVQALGEIGTPGADALARAIEGRDWDARTSGDTPKPLDARALEPLMIALEDDDVVVRRLSAWGLGEAGEARAVDALRRALEDDEADVRAQAAQSLGDIGSDAATLDIVDALYDDDVHVRERATHALGDIMDLRSLDGLKQARSSDTDAGVRHEATWAIDRINERRSQADAFGAIRSDDSETRIMAAHEMGDRRDPTAVPALLGVLGDDDVRVREKAAWALGEIRSSAATLTLIATASDEHETVGVRRQAIRALGEIGDASAAPALSRLLTHEDARLRSQAADALGDIGDERALELLKHAYRADPSDSVRENADKAIAKIVGKTR